MLNDRKAKALAACFAIILRLSNYVQSPLFWMQPLAWFMQIYTRIVPFSISGTRFPFLSHLCPPQGSIRTTTMQFDGSCPCIRLPAQKEDPCNASMHGIFYVHGGGFVSGEVGAFFGIASHLSKNLGCDVYLPDYPLAPEASLDKMIADCAAWFHYLAPQRQSWTIVADSAGSYIALAMLQHMTHRAPKAQLVLLSPICSVQQNSVAASRSASPNDPTIPIAWFDKVMKIARKDHRTIFDITRAPSRTFPKHMYIIVSGNEHLYSDSLYIGAWACLFGIPAMFDVVPGMPHSFPLYFPHLKAGAQSMERMLQWARGNI